MFVRIATWEAPVGDLRPVIPLEPVKAVPIATPDAPLFIGLRLKSIIWDWPANRRFRRPPVARHVNRPIPRQREQPARRIRVHDANFIDDAMRRAVVGEAAVLEQEDLLAAAAPDSDTCFWNDVIDLFRRQAVGLCPTPRHAAAPFDQSIRRAHPERKSTRLNSSHVSESRMPSSA